MADYSQATDYFPAKVKAEIDFIIENYDGMDTGKTRAAQMLGDRLKIEPVTIRAAAAAKRYLKENPNNIQARKTVDATHDEIYNRAADYYPTYQKGEATEPGLWGMYQSVKDRITTAFAQDDNAKRIYLARRGFENRLNPLTKEIEFKKYGEPQWRQYDSNDVNAWDIVDAIPETLVAIADFGLMKGAAKLGRGAGKGYGQWLERNVSTPFLAGSVPENLRQEAGVQLNVRGEKDLMGQAGAGLANILVGGGLNLFNFLKSDPKYKFMVPIDEATELKAAANRQGVPLSKGMMTQDPRYRQTEFNIYKNKNLLFPNEIQANYQQRWDKIKDSLKTMWSERGGVREDVGANARDSISKELMGRYQKARENYDKLGKVFFKGQFQVSPDPINRYVEKLIKEQKFDKPTREYLNETLSTLEMQDRLTLGDLDALGSVIFRDNLQAKMSGDSTKTLVTSKLGSYINDLEDNVFQSLINKYKKDPKYAGKVSYLNQLQELKDEARTSWRQLHERIDTFIERPGIKIPGSPKYKISDVIGQQTSFEDTFNKVWAKGDWEKAQNMMAFYPNEFAAAQKVRRQELWNKAWEKTGEDDKVPWPFKLRDQWTSLSSTEKKMLFPDDKARQDMEDFVTILRNTVKTQNPSGTAETLEQLKAGFLSGDIANLKRMSQLYVLESPKIRKAANLIARPIGSVPSRVGASTGVYYGLLPGLTQPLPIDETYMKPQYWKFIEGK